MAKNKAQKVSARSELAQDYQDVAADKKLKKAAKAAKKKMK